jgi:hypothetical protein
MKKPHAAAAAPDITAWGFRQGSSLDKDKVRYSLNRKTVIKAPYPTRRYAIAPSATRIARGAFYDKVQLVELHIPDSVVEIEEMAFVNTRISQITIPAGVTKIPLAMCAQCYSLSDINLPYGITEIGAEAFWGCTALTSIVLPASVKSIKRQAFDGCDSLPAVDIPKGCRVSKSAFPAGCQLMTPKQGFLFRSRQALTQFADIDVVSVGWNPDQDFLFRARQALAILSNNDVAAVG